MHNHSCSQALKKSKHHLLYELEYIQSMSWSVKNSDTQIAVANYLQGLKKTWILACPLGKQVSHFGHFLPFFTYDFVWGWLAKTFTHWAQVKAWHGEGQGPTFPWKVSHVEAKFSEMSLPHFGTYFRRISRCNSKLLAFRSGQDCSKLGSGKPQLAMGLEVKNFGVT